MAKDTQKKPATSTDPAPTGAGPAVAMVRIAAKVPGFRRCGVAHPGEPTDYPADAFTAEQLAILMAEPNLVVQKFLAPGPGVPVTIAGDGSGQPLPPLNPGEEGTPKDAPGDGAKPNEAAGGDPSPGPKE